MSVSPVTTLVTGVSASVREKAIAALLEHSAGAVTALILEGLPDGSGTLDVFTASPTVSIARIAPGCLCCTGNLTMRVTLNRMLRLRPAHLYIGLATSEHLSRIRGVLSQPPYDNLLTLTKDLQV